MTAENHYVRSPLVKASALQAAIDAVERMTPDYGASAPAVVIKERVVRTLRDLAATFPPQDLGHSEGQSIATESVPGTAAAPIFSDMLDALRQWAAAEQMGDEEELQNARHSRDAAIARATGEAR